MSNIFKKHGKKVLIDSVVGAIIATVIVYVIVGPYNTEFVKILQGISEKGFAVNTCLIVFPAFLIACLSFNLAKIVIKENK